MNNMLVTGGCGFIGANFIRYLLEESEYEGNIINVDKLTYAGNLESLEGIKKKYPNRYAFILADICDREMMSKIFDEFEVDTVCNFAAESHVDRSIASPDSFMNTNIMGTFNLLEIARERIKSIELFHHVSTDEVFGSLGREGFFTEDTAYKPNSPYAASKASSDHIVRAYHKTYDLPVTISNCSNNYGPYQFPEKLIPLMLLNALEEKPLPVYGDGKNVRDWLYVRDHCIAVLSIMKRGIRGDTYNIGGNNEMENIRLVELVCDILDEQRPRQGGKSYRELIMFVKDRPGHDRRYAIDSTKINHDLSWSPEETFESGIRKTIDWYLENSEWTDRVKSGEYKNWIDSQYGER